MSVVKLDMVVTVEYCFALVASMKKVLRFA